MEKVKVNIKGKSLDAFGLLRVCQISLVQAGRTDDARKLQDMVVKADSHIEALACMGKYCELEK